MRIVFSAVLLLAAGVGASGRAMADDAEDRAVKAVEKAGGFVRRDKDKPGKPVYLVNFLGASAASSFDFRV
jgi:hypothetical protein